MTDVGNFIDTGTELVRGTAQPRRSATNSMAVALKILNEEPEPMATVGPWIYRRTRSDFGYADYTDAVYRKAALLCSKCPEKEGVMGIVRGFTRIPQASEYSATPYFYLYENESAGERAKLMNRHWEPFNLSPDLVAFYDGTYNVRTGEFKPWERPVFGPMVTLEYKSLADARATPQYLEFEQTLETVMPDELARKHFRKVMGTILQPHVGQKCGIWIKGPSGSRKSTIATALLAAPAGVGGFSACPIDELADDKWKRVSLIGKWANLSDDAGTGRKWASFFKRYTGSSVMEGEFKFQQSRNYPATAKLVMCCNKIPFMGDSSDAIWTRLAVFEFRRDGELDDMFVAQSADNSKLSVNYWTDVGTRTCLVNWMVRGLRDRITDGTTPPESVRRWNTVGVEASDPVRAALIDCFERGSEADFVSSADLRETLEREGQTVSPAVISEYVKTLFNANRATVNVKDASGQGRLTRGFKGVKTKHGE